MIDFVVEFLYSNVRVNSGTDLYGLITLCNIQNIGIIANEWLLQADQQPKGIFSPECLRLSKLHSDAVDYQKTGIPVSMHSIPKRKRRQKPDWNRPELSPGDTGNGYYRSKSWVGQLFRAIKMPELPPSAQNAASAPEDLDLETIFNDVKKRLASPQDTLEELVRKQVSQFMEVDQYEPSHLEEIRKMYNEYRVQLSAIRHGCALTPGRSNNSPPATPLTEQDIMLGTISALCAQGQNHVRKGLISGLREQMGHLCCSVREGLAAPSRTQQKEETSGEDFLLMCKESLSRAWTAYGLSLISRDHAVGAESFGCIALGEVFDNIERMKGYHALHATS